MERHLVTADNVIFSATLPGAFASSRIARMSQLANALYVGTAADPISDDEVDLIPTIRINRELRRLALIRDGHCTCYATGNCAVCRAWVQTALTREARRRTT